MPILPGVTFRPLAGADDALPYVALIEACRDTDKIDTLSPLESLLDIDSAAAYFAWLEPENMLAVMVKQQMIGFTRVSWWTEADGTWLYLHIGKVHPHWRGQGLGTTLVHWGEQRLHSLAAQHPTNGKGSFGANASSTESSATTLLLNEGYKVYYTNVQMESTDFTHLPSRPLPAGCELRPVLPHLYRTIWEASRRYWAGLSAAISAPTEENYQDFLHLVIPDPTLLKVAWLRDQPIAIVQCHIAQGVGFIDDVVVAPQYKRRGLAQALMQAALLEMREHGVQRVRLHTDARDRHGARSLYEKLGFRTIKTYPRYRKAMQMAT